MPLDAYVPLIHLTDASLPNALKLAAHVTDLVADYNARGDVLAYGEPRGGLPPPAQLYPISKGMLAWHLPTGPRSLEIAKTAGFSWVAVKIHNGREPFGNGAALNEFVRDFKAAGIRVYGWGYVYLNDPIAEAEIAALQSNNLQLDGYIIDAEGEAAAAGAAATAQFCAALQPILQTHTIGLCSYRYPTLHMDLAWRSFLAICTFHCPQVYWLGATADAAPAAQLARSVRELQAIMPLPVVPIGAAFPWTPTGGSQWLPTVAQLQSFIGQATALKLPGYAWYDWESAELYPDLWQTIISAPAG